MGTRMHDVTLDAHNVQQEEQLRQRVFAQYAKFPDMGDKAVLDKLNEDIDWCIRSLAEGRIEAYLVPNREIVLHFLSFEWEMKYERQEIKDGKVVTRYPSYHLDDSMRDYHIHRWLCDWVKMLGTLAKSIGSSALPDLIECLRFLDRWKYDLKKDPCACAVFVSRLYGANEHLAAEVQMAGDIRWPERPVHDDEVPEHWDNDVDMFDEPGAKLAAQRCYQEAYGDFLALVPDIAKGFARLAKEMESGAPTQETSVWLGRQDRRVLRRVLTMETCRCWNFAMGEKLKYLNMPEHRPRMKMIADLNRYLAAASACALAAESPTAREYAEMQRLMKTYAGSFDGTDYADTVACDREMQRLLDRLVESHARLCADMDLANGHSGKVVRARIAGIESEAQADVAKAVRAAKKRVGRGARSGVRDKAKAANKKAVVAQMRKLHECHPEWTWAKVVSFMKGQGKWKEKMLGIKDTSWISYAKCKRK